VSTPRVPWQLSPPDPCEAEADLRGNGRMQGRAQVCAGDVGDHRVGGALGAIAGHARRHLLWVADGARVVDERVADRGELGGCAGRRVVGSPKPAATCTTCAMARSGEMLTRDLTDDRGMAGSC
jgi:hypothetical protein